MDSLRIGIENSEYISNFTGTYVIVIISALKQWNKQVK